MQLIEVNKARYRRHLNIVIAMCIFGLTLGSLGIAQLLILLFPHESGSHFHWNLIGVVVSCSVIGFLLHTYRHHHFMTEVVYVWNLKQSLNKINRKLHKIKSAANRGSRDAMLALQYSFSGSKLLWQLDDNTILMDELGKQQVELDALTMKYSITLDISEYREELLQQF